MLGEQISTVSCAQVFWAASCQMELFCFRNIFSLVVDLSHQHVYGVIASHCSKDLKGSPEMVQLWLPDRGLCWQSLGREGNQEMESRLWLWAHGFRAHVSWFLILCFSYIVKSSTLAGKCFTQVTGIIRIIWGSFVLWLKSWGTQNASIISILLLASKRIKQNHPVVSTSFSCVGQSLPS